MGTRIKDLSAALGLPFAGDGTLEIRTPTRPADAGPSDLAVAMTPTYAEEVAASDARAAILWDGADWESLGLEAAIFTGRPRFAMAGLTGAFDTPYEVSPGIHPTAIVDPSADLGEDVAVGPFAIVGKRTKIGKGARIHAHVVIGDDVDIGEAATLLYGARVLRRVQIGARFIAHANAVIGTDGFSFVTPEAGVVDEVRRSGTLDGSHEMQSYARIHSLGSVRIGDDVEVGANATIDKGTIVDTTVGNGTKIDNLVHGRSQRQRRERSCLLLFAVVRASRAVHQDADNRVVLGGAGRASRINLDRWRRCGDRRRLRSSLLECAAQAAFDHRLSGGQNRRRRYRRKLQGHTGACRAWLAPLAEPTKSPVSNGLIERLSDPSRRAPRRPISDVRGRNMTDDTVRATGDRHHRRTGRAWNPKM